MGNRSDDAETKPRMDVRDVVETFLTLANVVADELTRATDDVKFLKRELLLERGERAALEHRLRAALARG